MNRKLKPWVVNLLIIISFISVCLMFGDCESDLLFIIKSIACLFVFMFCSYTIYKLGGLNENVKYR